MYIVFAWHHQHSTKNLSQRLWLLHSWTPLMIARSWHRNWLKEILSGQPDGLLQTHPSPYISLPLMSIVNIARWVGSKLLCALLLCTEEALTKLLVCFLYLWKKKESFFVRMNCANFLHKLKSRLCRILDQSLTKQYSFVTSIHWIFLLCAIDGVSSQTFVLCTPYVWILWFC